MTIDPVDHRETQSPGTLSLAIRWYSVGFGLLGGAIGYMAGASQTPVVATLLSLLFGLIGGAGGIYLARADLSRHSTQLRLIAIGKSLVAFVVMLLMGAVLGTSLRTGIGLPDFFSPLWSKPPQTDAGHADLTNLSASEALEMLLLRAQLKALDATDSDLSTMHANVGGNVAAADIVAALRTLLALAHEVRENITPEILPRRPPNDDGSLEAAERRSIYQSAHSLRVVVLAIEEELSYYEQYISVKKKTIPLKHLTQRIDDLRGQLEKSIHSESGAEWLSDHEGLRTALYRLVLEMIDTDLKLGHWASGTELQKQINDFLIARSGQARSQVAAPDDTGYKSRGFSAPP